MVSKRLSYLVLIMLMQAPTAYSMPKINNSTMPIRHFTGRAFEIKEIEKRLFKNGQNVVTLVGIGGVGKTQIIRKFIQRNRSKYDVIWEINCASNISRQIKELGAAVSEKFEIPINIPRESARGIEAIWKALHSKKLKYLIIFDNLQILQNQLLDSILPKEISGHILMTTRDQEGVINVLKIHMLDQVNSIDLIKRLNANKSLDTLRIYKATSGHPLSIYKYVRFSNINKYLDAGEINQFFFKEYISDDLGKYISDIISQLDPITLRSLVQITMLNNSDISKENFRLLCAPEQNLQSLHSLIRFGLLDEKINYQQEVYGFEMHDVLKYHIKAIVNKSIMKEAAYDLINNVNKLLNNSYLVLGATLSRQPNLLQHCEMILESIEMSNIKAEHQLEFRSNLASMYLYYTEYAPTDTQLEWINRYVSQLRLSYTFDERLLNLVANFHLLKGLYNHFCKSDNKAAGKAFSKALEVLQNCKHPEPTIEYRTRTQLAQNLLYAGDLASAEKHIEYVRKFVDKLGDVKHDLDVTLCDFVSAKIFLEKGEYSLALNSIDKDLATDTGGHIEHALAPSYSLKADILERMGNARAGMKFAQRAHDKVRQSLKRETELSARVLISLARCEKSINKLKEAKEHIMHAKRILQEERKYTSFIDSDDSDLADVLSIEGELSYLEQDNKKAMELLLMADSIYSKVFSPHLRLDQMKKLYQFIINVAESAQDDFIAKMYLKKLEVLYT